MSLAWKITPFMNEVFERRNIGGIRWIELNKTTGAVNSGCDCGFER